MRRILIGVLGPGEGDGQKEMDDASLIEVFRGVLMAGLRSL
jgi:hypothetical protein